MKVDSTKQRKKKDPLDVPAMWAALYDFSEALTKYEKALNKDVQPSSDLLRVLKMLEKHGKSRIDDGIRMLQDDFETRKESKFTQKRIALRIVEILTPIFKKIVSKEMAQEEAETLILERIGGVFSNKLIQKKAHKYNRKYIVVKRGPKEAARAFANEVWGHYTISGLHKLRREVETEKTVHSEKDEVLQAVLNNCFNLHGKLISSLLNVVSKANQSDDGKSLKLWLDKMDGIKDHST